ncbi:hypothetical protein AAMO2058_000026600 [Amorphochlora amoebiformis]
MAFRLSKRLLQAGKQGVPWRTCVWRSQRRGFAEGSWGRNPLSTFLFGRQKTEEELKVERDVEEKRLARIAALPPADHKELLDEAIVTVRKDTLTLYQTVIKRRQLGRIRRFFRKTVPSFRRDIGLLGPRKTFFMSARAGVVLVAWQIIFDVLGMYDRLLGWGFNLMLLTGYLWSSDDVKRYASTGWFKIKYPEGLSPADLQYELRIKDIDKSDKLFDVITENAPEHCSGSGHGQRLSTDIVLEFLSPSYHYENALEMLLESWDFDKHGTLNKHQVIPIIVTLINGEFLKPQEGAEYMERRIEDFPPNWKEPHKEEVLVWPLEFNKDDEKTRRRAAEQEMFKCLHFFMFTVFILLVWMCIYVYVVCMCVYVYVY